MDSRLPKGLLHWCAELELSDCQIRTSLTFAHECCMTTFDRVFQYKIVAQILPTSEYLYRYKVKDTSTCEKCLEECDTIIHRLYECELVIPVVNKFFKYLYNKCDQNINISAIDYLFGIRGAKYNALNQILLELKKRIFYSTIEELLDVTFCEQFISKLRSLMIKEKQIMLKNNALDKFCSKWKDFSSIYDFNGPDCLF